MLKLLITLFSASLPKESRRRTNIAHDVSCLTPTHSEATLETLTVNIKEQTLHSAFYHCKLSIFGFWIVVQHFNYFLTFYGPNNSLINQEVLNWLNDKTNH